MLARCRALQAAAKEREGKWTTVPFLGFPLLCTLTLDRPGEPKIGTRDPGGQPQRAPECSDGLDGSDGWDLGPGQGKGLNVRLTRPTLLRLWHGRCLVMSDVYQMCSPVRGARVDARTTSFGASAIACAAGIPSASLSPVPRASKQTSRQA